MLLQNHKDDVENPDNVPSEYKTDDTCYDFAFRKSCKPSENPRSYGDNSQDNADYIAKTKIIALFFFFLLSFKYFYIYIISYNLNMSIIFKKFLLLYIELTN